MAFVILSKVFGTISAKGGSTNISRLLFMDTCFFGVNLIFFVLSVSGEPKIVLGKLHQFRI